MIVSGKNLISEVSRDLLLCVHVENLGDEKVAE